MAAIAADTRPGKDHVAVGGAHLDGIDHLDQVHAVSLCKYAPFVQVGKNRRPVGVFDYLGCLRLDRPVHYRQRKVISVQNLGKELHHSLTGACIAAGTDPPEVANTRYIVLAGHNPFETMGEKGGGINPAFGKSLLEDRPGTNSWCLVHRSFL